MNVPLPAAVLAGAFLLFLGLWLGLHRPRVDRDGVGRDSWPDDVEFQP